MKTEISLLATAIVGILLIIGAVAYLMFGNENQTHSWSLWGGHTVTETVIIDGNKYIKLTDGEGRTTLTPVPHTEPTTPKAN